MYLIERVLHYPYFPRQKADGLVSLSLNYLLFQFAVGMIAGFGVLFLFQLGGDFFEGIAFVLLFFLFQRLVTLFSLPFVGRAAATLGYRWVMFAGLICLTLKLFFLAQIDGQGLFFLVPALIFGGIAIPSYYVPFHALFLDDNDDGKIGEQFGLIVTLGGFATVFSPFIAGLLIERFGFGVMFSFALFLIAASSLPLFLMKFHPRHKSHYSFKKVLVFGKERVKISLAMFFWFVTDGIQAFWWPIYLFSILGSYASFGLLGSLAMVANSVSVYVSGRIYDKKPAKTAFLGASFLVLLTWVLRFTAKTQLKASFAEVSSRFVHPPWWMKIKRQELIAGESADSLVFGVFHELVVTFGYLTSLLIGFVLLITARVDFSYLIAPAIVGTLVTVILLKDD